jgi:pyruvate,orthophosphate dikinase
MSEAIKWVRSFGGVARAEADCVGGLIEMVVKAGGEVRADLEVGICGEHGGDPRSIALCHQYGLDYVSCSPFRVPFARLVAAHAALDADEASRRAES